MRVGKTYKRNDSLSDARYLCTGITTTGNAVALIKYINRTITKEFESIIFKEYFSKYEEVKEKLKGTKWLVIGTPNPVRSPPFISYVSFNTREEAESWIKITRHFTIFAIKEVQWEEGEGL